LKGASGFLPVFVVAGCSSGVRTHEEHAWISRMNSLFAVRMYSMGI